MKTLSDLKRELILGKKVVLLSRSGKEINEEREICHIQSNSIAFKTPTKSKCWLDYPKASLLEFDGVFIKIYKQGKRPLNEKEKTIKDGWEKLRDKEKEMKEGMTDGSSKFWLEKKYYKSHNAEYLIGHETQKGMRFDFNTGLVFDDNIKGTLDLVYKLI